MRIERHIFGSIDGYRTLAHSPGLSPSDCRTLEAFAFGTPYDPAVRASFAARPAYWSRPLDPNRRAITLVRLGSLDDAGRPTLLFISAVLSCEDWDSLFLGDAAPLLDDTRVWSWTADAPVPSIEISVPSHPAPSLSPNAANTALGILSLIETSWGTGKPVIIRDNQCTLTDIANVERLLPPDIRARFSVVYRALNSEMRSTLICLADGVAAPAGNPPRRLQGAASPYAKRLVQAGILEGRDHGRIVRTYNRFAQIDIEDADDLRENLDMRASCNEQPNRRAASAALLLCVACAAFVAGATAGWYLHRSPPPPANPWPAAMARFLQAPLVSVVDQTSALQSLSDDVVSYDAAVSTDIRDQLRTAIADRIEEARLIQSAESAITAASPENKASVDAAEKAVRAVEARGPTVSAATSRYWTAHRGSLMPQPDRLTRLMTEIYAEIRSLGAMTKRPLTAEADAERAAEAQSLMAAVTTIARIDPTLRDAGYDEAISSLTDFVKRTNDHRETHTSGGPNQQANLKEIDKQLARLVNAMMTPATTQQSGSQYHLVAEACRGLARACQSVDDYRRFEPPLSLLAEAFESGRTPTTSAPLGTISVDITLWPVLERCATATSAMRRNPRPKDALARFESAMRDLRRVANEKLPPTGPPK